MALRAAQLEESQRQLGQLQAPGVSEGEAESGAEMTFNGARKPSE
jgi:hypothetical protein